jgi:hypothetical protein
MVSVVRCSKRREDYQQPRALILTYTKYKVQLQVVPLYTSAVVCPEHNPTHVVEIAIVQ